MMKSARNNLNKLIHVINEVRNTKLCWDSIDCNLTKYRDKAAKAIADELQAFVDQIETDKYSMNRFEICNKLYDYKTIDVENSAAFHAETLLTYIYNKIGDVASCHAQLGANNGCCTGGDWVAAAKFVNYEKLAHDSIQRWQTALHFGK